jgi:hypothetical protein
MSPDNGGLEGIMRDLTVGHCQWRVGWATNGAGRDGTVILVVM